MMRKNRKSYTLVDSYKEYRKENPEDSGFSLSKIDYRNICIAFNQKLSDGIIEEANEFTVPGRLGLIKIKKFPTNSKYRAEQKCRGLGTGFPGGRDLGARGLGSPPRGSMVV